MHNTVTVRLPRGLTQQPTGWRLSVTAGGRVHQKRLKSSVPLAKAVRLLEEMQSRLRAGQERKALIASALPRSPRGWCYVYFIQQGEYVKVGRAVDVPQRLDAFNIGSPLELSLLVAVPAHADLEGAIHARFEHLRQKGEWFTAGPDLMEFISRLQTGVNPVALLW